MLEEVIGTCKILPSPGGLIPNPVAVSDAAGVPLLVTRDNFGAVAEKSLKQATSCFIRHRLRVSCPCTPVMLTLLNVRRLFQLEADRTGHVEPDKPVKLLVKVTSSIELREKMEDSDSCFVACLGTTKISLACVIRDEIHVPPTADG
jgi:hypothetical protein